MASLDDELMMDAQRDAEIVAYIQNHLPADLKEQFNEETIYYFLDLIVDYYTESGVLEAEPDEDGYVNIDLEAMAEDLAQKAKKEGVGTFEAEDLLFLIQAEMECEEQYEEE